MRLQSLDTRARKTQTEDYLGVLIQDGNMGTLWMHLLPQTHHIHRLIMKQFPLEEIQKLAEWLLYIKHKRKYPCDPYQNRQERLRHTFAIILTPVIVPYDWERTPTSQFLPEKWWVWTPHLVSQLVRLPNRGKHPKTSTSQSQWDLYLQDQSKQRNCSTQKVKVEVLVAHLFLTSQIHGL